MIKHGLIGCISMLIPLIAHTAPPKWDIVAKESQLTFTATQNGAPISGQFKTFNGTILVDPNDLKNSSITILVDINSLYASYPELKDTLFTPDWFSTKLFPEAVFKSTQIEKKAEKTYQAQGTLKIRDKLVPITLNFTGEQLSATKGTVSGSAILKRTQFGVGQGDWSSTNEIKDEVTVNFKVVAIKK
jgi:polyisoprenoid-binding protein YceI